MVAMTGDVFDTLTIVFLVSYVVALIVKATR